MSTAKFVRTAAKAVKNLNPRTRDPSDVFTPRGDKVTEMYIPRAGLEEKLEQYMAQNVHVLVHGESGCGKTWLYKKVFSKNDVFYRTVNLGMIDAGRGIDGVMEDVLARLDEKFISSLTEQKSAGVNAVVAEAGLESQRVYEFRSKSLFEQLLVAIRKRANFKDAALVFENLEHILGDMEALGRLKGLLLLLDDDDYSKYRVHIVLVTTASNFREYLSKVGSANTVVNRVKEVPEVGRLVPTQAYSFVNKGLVDLLGLTVNKVDGKGLDWYIQQILFLSDRIPQYLHELCLEVAYASNSTGRVLSEDVLKRGVVGWIKGAIVSEMTFVTSNLNSKATKKGRRNQLIYSIAACKDHDFDYQKIESIVREQFPLSCAGVRLNVSQGLSELASADMPLIRRNSNGNSYRIIDPRHKVLMRWLLYKEAGQETVMVRSFDDGVALE